MNTRFKLPTCGNFVLRDCFVGGEECVLVFPKAIGIVNWNESNKFFRSSIWRKSDMKPVSLGFKKFTNFGELPEFEPLDIKERLEFIKKMDGSLLMISSHNNQLVVRTRGTSDARILDNGYEIDFLINKYPRLFDHTLVKSGNWTILCEWTTPTNKIVIKESEEPTLWLIGIVRHHDYKYIDQKTLDIYSEEFGLQRPKRYNFNSFDEMKVAVEQFPETEGEGVVIYSQDGQTLKKVKSLRYLYLHKILAGLENEENIINLFLEMDSPDYNTFYNHFLDTFDWEIAEGLRGQISKTIDAWKECERIIAHFNVFANDLRDLPRKVAAAKVFEAYGDTNRAGYVFKALDNKPLDLNAKKKLMFQVLKK